MSQHIATLIHASRIALRSTYGFVSLQCMTRRRGSKLREPLFDSKFDVTVLKNCSTEQFTCRTIHI